MANGADTNKEFLSVPDASAHEEKKQLEQPAEKQKCMGVSKAGRQCIQFALPGCERCRRHAKTIELTDDNGSEAVPASGTKTQVAERILHARTRITSLERAQRTRLAPSSVDAPFSTGRTTPTLHMIGMTCSGQVWVTAAND